MGIVLNRKSLGQRIQVVQKRTGNGLAVPVSVQDNAQRLSVIGVDPETAEADACRIEHDISAETYERLKELVTKE